VGLESGCKIRVKTDERRPSMSGETFLDVLIAIMVIGSIFGAIHTRVRLRRHAHHTGATKSVR